jgi:hypothetical protein
MNIMMKHIAVALVATLTGLAVAFAQTVDVSGKWDVTFNTQQGQLPASMTLTKDADKITGTLSSQQGDTPVTAEVKDKGVTIYASVQTNNGALQIVMSGTVDGDAMKGTVDFGGRGSAEWSAKRTASAPAASQEKPAATMTGTWAIEATHSAGTSTPTATITQSGEKLSGKYVGSYGESELTGSIKANEFTFTVEIGQEQKVKVVYNGTLSGDTIKGSLTMGEMGEGTFTGKRK